MRHRGFTLIEMLMIVAVFAVVVIIGKTVFFHLSTGQTNTCASNLRQISLAIEQYKQDSNGRFPRVAVNRALSTTPPPNTSYGWADALLPYMEFEHDYQCPSEEHQSNRDATQSGFIDYWMNDNLSGLWDKKLGHPADVVLLGDGNDGNDLTTARYGKRALPPNWIIDKNSPAYRHNGGVNYLFADDHIKFIQAEAALDITFRPTLKPGG